MVDMMFGGLGIAAAFFLAFDLARANTRIVLPEKKLTTISFQVNGADDNKIQVIPLERQANGFAIDEATFSHFTVEGEPSSSSDIRLPGGTAHVFESHAPLSKPTFFLVFASQSEGQNPLSVTAVSQKAGEETSEVRLNLMVNNGWWVIVSVDKKGKVKKEHDVDLFSPATGNIRKLSARLNEWVGPEEVGQPSIWVKSFSDLGSIGITILYRKDNTKDPAIFPKSSDAFACIVASSATHRNMSNHVHLGSFDRSALTWWSVLDGSGTSAGHIALPNAQPCQGFLLSNPMIKFSTFRPRVEEYLYRVLQKNNTDSAAPLFMKADFSKCTDEGMTYVIGSGAIASFTPPADAKTPNEITAQLVTGGNQVWSNPNGSLSFSLEQVQRMNELHAFLQKETFDAGDPYAFCLDVLTMSNCELGEKELLFHPKMWTKTNSTSAP